MRIDGRAPDELRPVEIITDFTEISGGSVLIGCGKTRVLCTALLEEGTAPFLIGTGKGWLTAEYAMLPSSPSLTGARKKRESSSKPDGRSTEIKRIIGRSLRHAIDLNKIGERSIYIDCDVLTSDGGTRTASITGAYAALCLGVNKWLASGKLTENPLVHTVTAVSVGIVHGELLLDLCYAEDSKADVDMNLVTDEDSIIELGGTGEGRAFSRAELDGLLTLGTNGIKTLSEIVARAVNK